MRGVNKYRTLAANTALMSIGTFGSKLLVFLMVRFYTGYLTPAEYGTADLIAQSANLVIPLISLDVADGVFRFAADRRRGRADVFSVGLETVTVGTAMLFLGIGCLWRVPAVRAYGLLLGTFAAAFSNFMGSVYVVTKKSTASFWTSLAGAACNVALNLLLIPQWGIQGAAAATFISCLVVFLIRMVHARRLLPFPFSGGKLGLGIGVLLIQTGFLLFRWPGWIVVQGMGLGVLFLMGLPAVFSTAQLILHRK